MNDTAGSMVKDSLFNARSLRKLFLLTCPPKTCTNIVGGARLTGRPRTGHHSRHLLRSYVLPLRQDVAHGEVSLQGQVKAIGGVYEKVYGAKQAGMKAILLPGENAKGVKEVRGIDVVFVSNVQEALDVVCPSWRASSFCAG